MSVQSAMNQMLGSIGQLSFQMTAPERFAKEQQKVQKEEEEKIDKATEIELQDAIDVSLKDNDFGPASKAGEKKAEIAYRKFQRNPSQETFNTYKKLKEDADDWLGAYNQQKEAKAKHQAEKEALEAQKDAQIGLMEQRQVRQDLLNNLKNVSTKEMVNEIVSRGQMSEKASQRYINREKKGVSK